MRVFISYSRKDKKDAQFLRDQLRDWGHETWRDEDNISISEDWDTAIHNALKDADVIIGVITPNSLKSKNVLDEWAWALESNRWLLLILYKDVPREDIPPRYIRKQRIDLTEDFDANLEILRKVLASTFVKNRKPQSDGKALHVVPDDEGWAVKAEGQSRRLVRTRTQFEALEVARHFASNEDSEVLIHARDGRIRDRRTYRKRSSDTD